MIYVLTVLSLRNVASALLFTLKVNYWTIFPLSVCLWTDTTDIERSLVTSVVLSGQGEVIVFLRIRVSYTIGEITKMPKFNYYINILHFSKPITLIILHFYLEASVVKQIQYTY